MDIMGCIDGVFGFYIPLMAIEHSVTKRCILEYRTNSYIVILDISMPFGNIVYSLVNTT